MLFKHYRRPRKRYVTILVKSGCFVRVVRLTARNLDRSETGSDGLPPLNSINTRLRRPLPMARPFAKSNPSAITPSVHRSNFHQEAEIAPGPHDQRRNPVL